MIKRIIFLVSLLQFQSALAIDDQIKITPEDVSIVGESRQARAFSRITIKNMQNSTQVGAPALPVKSYLLKITPAELQVTVERSGSFTLANTLPAAAQPEKVRHPDATEPAFAFNEELYRHNLPAYTVEYLGDFRGTPISKLTVRAADYRFEDEFVEIHGDIQVNTNAEAYTPPVETNKNYLIITPSNLEDGIADFVAWKQSLGFNMVVVTLNLPELTAGKIKTLIADALSQSQTSFVLLVGSALPFNFTDTSGDYDTPSDLYYYTLGGDGDHVPDVFGGRIPGVTATDIRAHLAKSIEFEKKTYNQGQGRIIGIASNEGSSPSDNDYIKTIEQTFAEKYGHEIVHFYQNDSKSNPDQLNRALNQGASWLFYVGHGSGSSWPSMYETYSVHDMSQLSNQDQEKPIIIDVACMNGYVQQGYLGTSFASVLGDLTYGAAAYYGGTVNISWHPPAIMARGMAQLHAQENFNHLGEVLLAGQMHLAENYNSKEEVIDNFEWYVLQGDPSLNIHQQ